MANMSAQGTLPVAGGDINSEPVTDTTNHIMTTYNGENIDSGNCDTTSPDAVMTLDVAATRKAALTFGVDGTGHDLKLFGATAGAYALWDESADTFIVHGATAAGPGKLLLQTGETTNVDGGILGRIDFQAPADAAGTDAILVAASIWAEADDTFSATLNDTDLVFGVAESETALERMRLAWDGTTTNLHFAQVANISSTADITLTPVGDINIPANIGVTFGDDGEKIEGDGTDLTISGNIVNITPAASTNITAGPVYIGDTANANMTVGLTINQGTNDDEAFALKSSDVGHPFTDQAEADTYCTLSKNGATPGGVSLVGYRDADGSANSATEIVGRLGEAANTDDTATSLAVINLRAQVTDGGTSVTSVADAGDILSILNHTACRFLLKGNGDLHVTNVTAGGGDTDSTALDGEDDIGLVRTHQRSAYKDMGIAMSKWDEMIHSDEDDLKRLGVISSQGDFRIIQRYQDLLGGAIWKLHTRMMDAFEKLEKHTGVQLLEA